MEWSLSPLRDNDANKGFVKVITDPNGKIAGFHYLGPNAGEVTQAMALAVKAGATKEMLDDTIAIHPTTVTCGIITLYLAFNACICAP